MASVRNTYHDPSTATCNYAMAFKLQNVVLKMEKYSVFPIGRLLSAFSNTARFPRHDPISVMDVSDLLSSALLSGLIKEDLCLFCITDNVGTACELVILAFKLKIKSEKINNKNANKIIPMQYTYTVLTMFKIHNPLLFVGLISIRCS